MMELLAPAGNIEKLKTAYRFGADAVYIGLKNFSLRTRADNFSKNEHEELRRLKGVRKLYCALNIYFHNADLRRLEEDLDFISEYPFDAFIISDPGVIRLLKKRFPETELHLSTQANCTNGEAARLYRDLGFSRIITGREVSLKEIAEIKRAVPEVEIEAFVHGAMCLAYSGRCFLSSWMTGRSANSGDCAHSCRWQYRVLEEKERPGEYFPVEEGADFATILSSKDLCLIDHLEAFQDAGVDSLKIEGRMKSVYYTAVVTRAYRKALDALAGKTVENLSAYREELFNVSHREFTTGFYFDRADVEKSTEKSYRREYLFLGTVTERIGNMRYRIEVKNSIRTGDSLEFIGPDLLHESDSGFRLLDESFETVTQADHGKTCILETKVPLAEGDILRRREKSKQVAN